MAYKSCQKAKSVSIGLPMSLPDGQIAAIARSHHFKLATRNHKDFEECGLIVLNPFPE